MSRQVRFLLAALTATTTALMPITLPALSADNSQKQALHRADFRVEGASCVVCLRRIARTLRDNKGVLKADVSVFRPYWAIVIYDDNQTSFQHITDSIKQEHVKLVDLQDQPIKALPAIIIPKGMTAQDLDTPPLKESGTAKSNK